MSELRKKEPRYVVRSSESEGGMETGGHGSDFLEKLLGGTALNATLPKMSPLNPRYKTKKQTVFEKISAFVEKFKGVGGQI